MKHICMQRTKGSVLLCALALLGITGIIASLAHYAATFLVDTTHLYERVERSEEVTLCLLERAITHVCAHYQELSHAFKQHASVSYACYDLTSLIMSLDNACANRILQSDRMRAELTISALRQSLAGALMLRVQLYASHVVIGSICCKLERVKRGTSREYDYMVSNYTFCATG